jgi:hypothetical protein
VNRIITWADAFGIWHASVPTSPSERRDARRAIMAELLERAPRDTRASDISLTVEREGYASGSLCKRVIYRERVA